MRPTPAELISGVRRILRDVIEPDLSSEYAKARLGEIRAVLAQFDWDDAGIATLRETDALGELLSECRDWMGSEPWFADQRAGLDAALADRPGDEGLSTCLERKARYDNVVVELIDPIVDWLRAHPDDIDGERIRGRLIAHYAG